MRFIFLSVFLFSSLFSFAKVKQPIRPDYSQEKFWIALPTRHDIADTVPPGCSIAENQANAKVDVFYVHPTVYLTGKAWNGDLGDASLNKKCDDCVLNQATEYNACARVYAPRYRQAVLRVFTNPSPEGDAALDTAYSDVKKAFEYYLAHYNNGRPIILASHSQGSRHVAMLLKEFFDGKPLMKQLVAAYAIGMPIPKNYFTSIPVGDSANQFGCFITWNTVVWGTTMDKPYDRYNNCICVNPLSWKTDTATCSATLHQGAVPFGFKTIDEHFVQTKISGSLLWIESADAEKIKGYYHLGKSFHVSDVNFFYMDIRGNAIVRVNAYCAANGVK
ncbi:MAG TPA: DUF3089 domain-containing protein [Bacteroidia bacterium]|jgi:hypothetical protein|nr:DUF3089 domain-containing protein [Bacteroidia bacterium]